MGARYVWHWRALSVVFLYLAIDEATHIHEQLGEFLRLKLVDTSFAGPFTWGGLHLTWESLAGALVVLFVVVNLRFVAHLPARMRTLFLLAGALYVGGALGVELIAEFLFAHGGSDRTGSILSHVEELLEMQGVATFVYALLAYVRSYVQELTIHLGP